MLKKFLASLCVFATITSLLPLAIAADGDVTISLSASAHDVFSGNLTVTYLSKTGDLDISVKSGTTVVKQLLDITIPADMASPDTVTWDGKNAAGDYVANGSYTVVATLTGVNADTDIENLTLSSTLPVATPTFNHSSFDPVEDSSGLIVSYSTTPVTVNSITLSIQNQYGEEVHDATNSPSGATGSFSAWNGEDGGDYVEPGTYTAIVTASESGFTNGVGTSTFVIEYTNDDIPDIDLDSDVDSFDPDFDYATITIDVGDEEADIELLIRNDDDEVVRDYGETSSDGDETLEFTWDGKDDDDDELPLGDYQVIAIARNDNGATVDSIDIELDNDQGSIPSSNADINNIDFDSTFRPDEDDELKIEFNVRRDLDELAIYAVGHGIEYEIWSDSNVDSGDDEIEWDGTVDDDDDELAEEGKWRIEFRSTAEDSSTELRAAKYVNVKYDEPNIDDFHISKTSIDPDQDEVVYIMFRIDQDAMVDIYAYEDGDEDEDIETEMEVDGDEWYAVEWDGNGYDENDDVEIYLFARSENNEDIYDSEHKDISIQEDDVSSGRSNVTQDGIDPIMADRGDDMEIRYNLEKDAEVTITIYEGSTSSGDKVITLIDEEDQDEGDHVVEWDGKDDNGDSLSKSDEVYSYKIVSKKSSTDTEKGVFIISDDIGDYDDDDDNDGDDDDDGSRCAGFLDVPGNSKYCDAIEWANEEGIFIGYNDGTFKPYRSINRMEILKVILEFNDIYLIAFEGFDYGFTDVIPGAWYMHYLSTAKTLGIFSGDAGGKTARPADPVNRAEALKLMFESMRSAGKYAVPYCNSSKYTDVYRGSWYMNYACASDQFDLFDPYGNALSPGAFASRAEIAQALYNLHKAGF